MNKRVVERKRIRFKIWRGERAIEEKSLVNGMNGKRQEKWGKWGDRIGKNKKWGKNLRIGKSAFKKR